MALPTLMATKSTEIGIKTANVNIKQQFIHIVNNDGSKAANIIKR